MIVFDIVSVILGLASIAYLVYALLKPENFS